MNNKQGISTKFISIIIPSLNEEKNIDFCLGSISKLKWPVDLFEVILVDNGSTDGTVEIACRYKQLLNLSISVIKGVNVSALRNAGVRMAKGNLIGFLDADCTVSPDWLEKGTQYFIDESIGVTGCSHKIADSSSWVAKSWHLTIERNRFKGERTVLPSGNMFVSRVSFLQIGGFDETLITNEDYELCMRYRQHGFRVFSDPDIEATHLGIPSTVLEFFKQQLWHGTHATKVFLRNLSNIKNLHDLLPFKAVLFGFYSLILHVWVLFEFSLVCFNLGNIIRLMVPAIGIVLPPMALGFRIAMKGRGSFLQSLQLSFLYYVYSVARAISSVMIWKYI